ncbi:MAG: MATE family efflux transporter, partial [Lachnospiraceae bacterium]|nr:MATE family efflux transporter [Lachnospiraceae bacterium]
VARQLLVILPVAFVLARVGGLAAVWWAFPIAEIVAVIMSTVLFRRIYCKKIQPLSVS